MSFLGTLLGGAAGFMLGGPTGAAIGAGIGGGVDAANASKQAANVQAQSADQATQLQREMFQQQQQNQAPWLQAGQTALNALVPMATNYKLFDNNAFTRDPGYGFRLAEGQKALDRQAAARGGLISGGALKATERYGQEMGSQEYQNAFNRYQTERNAMLNPLQSLAGVGQTAANTLTNAAGNYGTNVGNLMTGVGNARASSYVGGANAMAGGLSSAANIYQNNQLLQRFGNQTPGGLSNAQLADQYYLNG